MSDREPIMQFFKYDHLPEKLQAYSRPFAELAEHIHETTARNPERSVALRKLLEAKDALVRAAIFVALLAVLLLPSIALAQDAVPAPSAGSLIGGFFAQFLTPTGIASAVVTVLGVVGGALSLSARRKRQIAIVTEAAFHGVYDFAATTETDVDDKVAAGLKIANEWMLANGWRPLKPNEEAVAKLGFQALNGATKAAEAVQTAALVAAKGPPAP